MIVRDKSWDIKDASKLQTYLECPRSYFYQYILGCDVPRPKDICPTFRKAAWKITELSTGHFIAEATEDNTLCYPERRVYFSRHSLEQDFGQP